MGCPSFLASTPTPQPTATQVSDQLAHLTCLSSLAGLPFSAPLLPPPPAVSANSPSLNLSLCLSQSPPSCPGGSGSNLSQPPQASAASILTTQVDPRTHTTPRFQPAHLALGCLCAHTVVPKRMQDHRRQSVPLSRLISSSCTPFLMHKVVWEGSMWSHPGVPPRGKPLL